MKDPVALWLPKLLQLTGRLYWNVLPSSAVNSCSPLGISHAMFVNEKSVSSTVDVIRVNSVGVSYRREREKEINGYLIPGTH